MALWTPDITTEAAMAADQRVVFHALWAAHIGRAQAISQGALAEATGIAERELRDILASIIIAHRVPIGSATSPPPGYYVIATTDEAAETYRMLRGYGISILTRAAVIRRVVSAIDLRRIQTEIPFPYDTVRGL